MGEYGRIDRYKPAYSNTVISNHAFLSFTLTNIRSPAADLEGTQDLLVRYIGALDGQITERATEIIKPWVWLRWIVDVFIWILESVGLIGGTTPNKIRNHFLINLITLLGSLASLISLGFLLSNWEPLSEFFTRIFRWLRFIEGS